MRATFSLPRYLANGAVALATALGMFALTMLLPALLRRSRWRLGKP